MDAWGNGFHAIVGDIKTTGCKHSPGIRDVSGWLRSVSR
jgi:hypothetical protein